MSSSDALPFGFPLPPTPPGEEAAAARAVDTAKAHRFETGIEVRDGTELAADVYLPDAEHRPAPAVIVGTPYDKSQVDEPTAPYQEAGYARVTYDVRGRGKSEGIWHAHEYEVEDAYDVIEWVVAQEWCNGDVGIAGISYLGGMVWKTMAARHPALRAAISTAPEGRWQQECPYNYGCFWLYYEWWYMLTRRRILGSGLDIDSLVQVLPVEKAGEVLATHGPGWQEALDHDTLDELWRSRRWDGEYDYDIPTLHVGGWYDRQAPTGLYHHYEEMMSTSPARDRQWLLVGPWDHGAARFPVNGYLDHEAPAAAIDMTAIHLAFFDRFLKGVENGFEREAPVRVYDTGALGWRARQQWQGATREEDLFLGADGQLAEEAGEDGETGYRYDPMRAPGLRFEFNTMDPRPPIDLGELESQEGVVTWTSAPLERDLTVHGWSELELWAATDGEDTEWHAKVGDVAPDGRSLCVTWGCLRASYGDDAGNPAPLTPGEAKRYSIELVPAFHTIRAGHRVRLVLASADFPWFARNMNRFGPIAKQDDPRVAANTVFHGAARPSRLRLRVEER